MKRSVELVLGLPQSEVETSKRKENGRKEEEEEEKVKVKEEMQIRRRGRVSRPPKSVNDGFDQSAIELAIRLSRKELDSSRSRSVAAASSLSSTWKFAKGNSDVEKNLARKSQPIESKENLKRKAREPRGQSSRRVVDETGGGNARKGLDEAVRDPTGMKSVDVGATTVFETRKQQEVTLNSRKSFSARRSSSRNFIRDSVDRSNNVDDDLNDSVGDTKSTSILTSTSHSLTSTSSSTTSTSSLTSSHSVMSTSITMTSSSTSSSWISKESPNLPSVLSGSRDITDESKEATRTRTMLTTTAATKSFIGEYAPRQSTTTTKSFPKDALILFTEMLASAIPCSLSSSPYLSSSSSSSPLPASTSTSAQDSSGDSTPLSSPQTPLSPDEVATASESIAPIASAVSSVAATSASTTSVFSSKQDITRATKHSKTIKFTNDNSSSQNDLKLTNALLLSSSSLSSSPVSNRENVRSGRRRQSNSSSPPEVGTVGGNCPDPFSRALRKRYKIRDDAGKDEYMKPSAAAAPSFKKNRFDKPTKRFSPHVRKIRPTSPLEIKDKKVKPSGVTPSRRNLRVEMKSDVRGGELGEDNEDEEGDENEEAEEDKREEGSWLKPKARFNAADEAMKVLKATRKFASNVVPPHFAKTNGEAQVENLNNTNNNTDLHNNNNIVDGCKSKDSVKVGMFIVL